MAKKMTKAEMDGIALLFVLAIPVYFIFSLGESIGWIPLAILVLGLIAIYFWGKAEETKKRREALLQKYQNTELVEMIMNKNIWQGQTTEQLLDSLGRPVDLDEKVLKTKKREVWKYDHQGANRYNLRVTLDNDLVVGWDKKG
ncbi:MAG: DUF2845 domain-containing protein [Alphaproteobacteria bacterium]